MLFVLTFYLELKVNANEDHESPLYVQYVDEVTSTFLNEMYTKYGFECGATGGSMPYDVEEIWINLVTKQTATIEQAREWEILAVERLVQIVNEHEKIKPFLRENPFPPKRAVVSIRFAIPKKDHSSPASNDVERVLQGRGRIFYKVTDPDNPYIYKTLKEEPYADALKIVQSNAGKKIIQKPK